MIRLSFTAKAITPLVIAGAGGPGAGPTQEGLRGPSLRGVMRFWFRAMMGGVVDTSGGYDALWDVESRVFGSTKAGSAVRVRTSAPSVAPDTAYLCMNDQRTNQDPGAGKNYRGISKAALQPGSRFDVEIQARTQAPLELAAQALWLATTLGGIGNRARRGFGSLSLEWKAPPSAGELRRMLPDLAYPDGDLESIAAWLQSGVSQVRSSYAGFAGATRSCAPAGFSTLSKGTARLWLVTSQEKFWKSWSQAMDGLRDVLYRPYKGARRIDSIGSANPRLASPLIIQIKRTSGGDYFGVLLAFENAHYLGPGARHLDAFLTGASSLKRVEVALP